MKAIDVQRGLRAAGMPVSVTGTMLFSQRVADATAHWGIGRITSYTEYWLWVYSRRYGFRASFTKISPELIDMNEKLGLYLYTEPALSDIQWLER